MPVAPPCTSCGSATARDARRRARTRWRIEKDPADVPNGAVASENGLATDVGVSILRRGGNAVDAAVATAFALAVVEPAACGLGGGGVLLLDGPGRSAPVAIDFAMTAPRAAAGAYELLDGIGPSRFGWRKVRDDANMHGPSAAATPGFVAGLDLALRTFGTHVAGGRAGAGDPARRARHRRHVALHAADRVASADDGAIFPTRSPSSLRAESPLDPGGAFSRADRLVQRDLGRTLRVAGARRDGRLPRGRGRRDDRPLGPIERHACSPGPTSPPTSRWSTRPPRRRPSARAGPRHPGPVGLLHRAADAERRGPALERSRIERPGPTAGPLRARIGAAFADRRHWSTAPSDGDIPYAELLGAENAARHADEIDDERARRPRIASRRTRRVRRRRRTRPPT